MRIYLILFCVLLVSEQHCPAEEHSDTWVKWPKLVHSARSYVILDLGSYRSGGMAHAKSVKRLMKISGIGCGAYIFYPDVGDGSGLLIREFSYYSKEHNCLAFEKLLFNLNIKQRDKVVTLWSSVIHELPQKDKSGNVDEDAVSIVSESDDADGYKVQVCAGGGDVGRRMVMFDKDLNSLLSQPESSDNTKIKATQSKKD